MSDNTASALIARFEAYKDQLDTLVSWLSGIELHTEMHRVLEKRSELMGVVSSQIGWTIAYDAALLATWEGHVSAYVTQLDEDIAEIARKEAAAFLVWA
jgi:hypothetical protein